MDEMTTLKEHIVNKKVRFVFFKDNELWYETELGFQFPVPTNDVGNGVFLAEDKALLFMRWIRKHIETVESWKKEKCINQ